MRAFLHRLAHLFGRYQGDVKTWREDGFIIAGYECRTCGNREGVHRVSPWVYRGEAPPEGR